MKEHYLILQNQLVIMEGFLQLLWDSSNGHYKADDEYIEDLERQISETKQTLKDHE